MRKRAICVFCLLSAAFVGEAKTIDVQAGGDIAAAVAEAEDNDVVQLAVGEYTLSAAVTINKPVTVRGVNRLMTRIFSDGETHQMFVLKNAAAVVSHVTISGAITAKGKADANGAVRIVSGELRDAMVCDCECTDGHSAAVLMTGGAIRRCILCDNVNRQGYGSGVYPEKGLCLIENSLVCRNVSTYGGGTYVPNGIHFEIVNCTFANNRATIGGNDIYDYSGKGGIHAVNTICGSVAGSSDASVYENCHKSNQDPGFVFFVGDNFRLLESSSCYLAGRALALDEAETSDVDGNPFPEGNPSIGAYQPVGDGVSLAVPSSAIVLGESASVTAHLPSSGTAELRVFGPDGSAFGPYAVTDGEPVELTPAAIGRYAFALTTADGEVFDWTASLFVGTTNTYYDSNSATPAYPYATPETAATTLGDAQLALLDGGTVWVCDGTHRLSSTVNHSRPVTIRGLNGRDRAIFQPSAAVRLFNLVNKGTKLVDLTLRGYETGFSTTGQGVCFNGDGGLVENCIFENFITSGSNVSGPAVSSAANCAGELERCIFRNNKSARYGGAVYVPDKARIDMRNCLFHGNTCSGGWGSAVYNDGYGSMVNCTLFNNKIATVANGEFCRNFAEFGVTNCIIGSVSWYKGTSCRANNLGSSSSLSGVIFRDAGNDDYRLASTAADAIDQGLDDVVRAGELDVAGAARITGDHVDIGCYEFSVDEFAASVEVSGVATAVCEKVTLVPVVVGGQSPVNTWRVVNHATGLVLSGETHGTGESAAFEVEFAEPGVYSASCSVVDGENEATIEMVNRFVIMIPVGGGDVYVATAGCPVAPFDTPETALTNLAVAAKIAPDNVMVRLLPGTHTADERVTVTRGIALVGSGADETVVTCADGANHGILGLNHAASSIRNLTVTGRIGSKYADGSGHGVRVVAGLLEDCRVVDLVSNAADDDGLAVSCVGTSSRISRVAILNCTGGRYGVLYMNGGGRASCCLVAGCSTSSKWGAGVYIDGIAYLTNCTFSATQEKSVYMVNTATRLVNCAIDCPIVNGGADSFVNCASSVGHPFPSGVEQDLAETEFRFRNAAAGDYRPWRGSSLLSGGLLVPAMEKWTDLEGQRLVWGGKAPIGCYASPFNRGLLLLIR